VKKKNQKKKSDSSDVPAFPFESESKDEKKSKKSKSIKEGKKSDSNSMKSECQNIEGEKVKKSDENNFPTLKMDEKDNLRQKLEEKSKKYQHLPVYDKDEEKRLAESRTEKINQIFSDVDKDLEKVTDLTSTHMENKGIKMKSTDYNQIETNLHTINYKSGVLKNRRSAEQTQGDSEPEPNPTPVTPKTPDPKYSLPPYKRESQASASQQSETYESLGQTFRDLTDKMQTVTQDLRGDGSEIPFVDEGSDEDYRDAVRSQDDPDTDLDAAIFDTLKPFVDQEFRVEKIQLEVAASESSTSLMVTERRCFGTDTIHLRKKTIRRDYIDI